MTDEEFESDLEPILDGLKKGTLSLGKAIDQVFASSNDLSVLQERTKSLLQKYYQEIKPGKSQENSKNVAKKVDKICDKFKDEKEEKLGIDLGKNKTKDPKKEITGKSKENLKRITKGFAVYEAYKVMNPKRIAGETKKDNYKHNMMMGGEKRAGKYEGGSKADLKKYGKAEVNKIKREAGQFQKSGRTI